MRLWFLGISWRALVAALAHGLGESAALVMSRWRRRHSGLRRRAA
jgi:hypothetical protein